VKPSNRLGKLKHNGRNKIKEEHYYLQIATVTLNDV
jgi:hypothetical protein